MKLNQVAPIGTQTAVGMHGRAELPVYRVSDEAARFRALRMADPYITQREAGALCGIAPVDVFAIEGGSKVPDDWAPLLAALEKHRSNR